MTSDGREPNSKGEAATATAIEQTSTAAGCMVKGILPTRFCHISVGGDITLSSFDSAGCSDASRKRRLAASVRRRWDQGVDFISQEPVAHKTFPRKTSETQVCSQVRIYLACAAASLLVWLEGLAVPVFWSCPSICMVGACTIMHFCCSSFAMFACYDCGRETSLSNIVMWRPTESDICIDMLQVAFTHSNEGSRRYRSSAARRLRYR